MTKKEQRERLYEHGRFIAREANAFLKAVIDADDAGLLPCNGHTLRTQASEAVLMLTDLTRRIKLN